ncbi:MAG TPA: hypothetical protein P5299_02085 [Candidatus Woesebacteria bacterium]|nr:hypothetical protein [Candidatus Woesebacteria bacterium]
MAEFKRSRLARKTDEQITRKTVFLGAVTIILFLILVVFGLPLLVRFSIFLGENRRTKDVIQEKVLPPQPPRVILPYEATNTAKIDITGVAEPKVKVILLKDDVNLEESQVSNEGEFVFKEIVLDNGDNVFTLVAESAEGERSELSKPIKVTYDKEPPVITMENPIEDSSVVDKTEFEVKGKTERGISVMINNHVAMVDDEGNFNLTIQLNAGNNEVEIIARDVAGNETKKKVTIKCDI